MLKHAAVISTGYWRSSSKWNYLSPSGSTSGSYFCLAISRGHLRL